MVYVTNRKGKALMPTDRHGKVRELFYVFGRRKSGYFDIRRLNGIKVNKGSINCKKLRLVEIRRILLIERRNSSSIPPRS